MFSSQTSHSYLSLCYHQLSPVWCWFDKEWEECMWRLKIAIESFSPHLQGPCYGWLRWEWDKREAITGAAEATCPAQGAGKWCSGSVRAVGRFPQPPPAYGAPPNHHQPPSESWQWAKQPENLPLLRWSPPASVALPKRIKQKNYWIRLRLFPSETLAQTLSLKWYLFHNKASSLCLLLGHLFHLNSLCEFFAKGQMCLKKNVYLS